MYIDLTSYHIILAIAWFAPISLMTLGVVLLRGKTVGGLTFCQIGRLGFSFYITRA
jgi:hypothetical protein